MIQSSTLICPAHTFMAFRYDKALFYDQLLELFLFNLIGPVVGAPQSPVDVNRFGGKIPLTVIGFFGRVFSEKPHEL
jgi:hypothetical protein